MLRSVILAATASLAVAANAAWSDNFDSYANGQQLHGVGGWVGWDNVPGAGALVSNAFSFSPSNSVEITGATDLVQIFSGATSGKWEFTGKVYIPGSFSGSTYFILLSQYNHGGPYQWAVQLHFDASTNTAIEDMVAGTPVAFARNVWNDLKVAIDLDADQRTVSLNNQVLSTGTWKGTTGFSVVAALDLYANLASPVYYDDLKLARPKAPLNLNVTLQDWSGAVAGVPITVLLTDAGSNTETHTASLDGSGNAAIETDLRGALTINTKASHWLAKSESATVTDAGGSASTSLVNGDVDNDNVVTVFDYNALSDAFDTVDGDANWNPEADLDGDGAVTVFDYNILSSNFDLVGD